MALVCWVSPQFNLKAMFPSYSGTLSSAPFRVFSGFTGGSLTQSWFPLVQAQIAALARCYTRWSILFLLILDLALGTRLKYIKFYMASVVSYATQLKIIWETTNLGFAHVSECQR